MEDFQDEYGGYRDMISTVDTAGKRRWIYAFEPKGKWINIRALVTFFYLAFFFSMPFIKYNGNPLFMFNIPKGYFVLFGQVFLPQDFIILGVAMVTALVMIVVFTLVFGRIFCGWICPQTVFLEMIFRKIEFLIEGPAHKQAMNDRNKTPEIWIRKIIKHIIFLLISFLVANTFLSYVIGVDELLKIMREPVSEHFAGFFAIIAFTLAFYAVFAYVREIVCTVICPYGRLQGVLMDKDSIAVAYDYNRGEPRGKKRKGPGSEELGDCIDCNMCVNVCPTGIDIRNGLQMECTNCTACIDACDMMMTKVGKPINLITFASENQLAKNEKFKLNYRAKISSVALIVLVGVLTTMLFMRSQFQATILRVPGQLLQENKDGTISNLYKIDITSKNSKTQPYNLRVVEKDAVITFVGNKIDSLESGKRVEETFFIKIPANKVTQRRNTIHVQIMSGEKVIETKKISFIGPY